MMVRKGKTFISKAAACPIELPSLPAGWRWLKDQDAIWYGVQGAEWHADAYAVLDSETGAPIAPEQWGVLRSKSEGSSPNGLGEPEVVYI